MNREQILKGKAIIDKIEVAQKAKDQLTKVKEEHGGYTPTLSTKFVKLFKNRLIEMIDLELDCLEAELSSI